MSGFTALQMVQRVDARRRRAEAFLGAVLASLDPVIPDDNYLRRDIYDALLKLFVESGYEVISDYDRQQLGLPARGPDGWTAEEIVALEARRLEVLTRPIQTIFSGTLNRPSMPCP